LRAKLTVIPVSEQLTLPCTGDVRFVFPESDDARWYFSTVLKEESPYFINLLTRNPLIKTAVPSPDNP